VEFEEFATPFHFYVAVAVVNFRRFCAESLILFDPDLAKLTKIGRNPL